MSYYEATLSWLRDHWHELSPLRKKVFIIWLRIIRKEDRMAKDDQERVFVTDDKAIHQGAILSSADKEILESVKTGEGMITIKSVEQLQEMAKAAAERFEEFKELCSPMELWGRLGLSRYSAVRRVVAGGLLPSVAISWAGGSGIRHRTRLWGWRSASGRRSSSTKTTKRTLGIER